MTRRESIRLLSTAACCGSSALPGKLLKPHAFDSFVLQALRRLESVTAGMTRQQLMVVVETEGGLWTEFERTFVSKDCPYFKVDVKFTPVGKPENDTDGRAFLHEDPRDRIAAISPPYLALSIMD